MGGRQPFAAIFAMLILVCSPQMVPWVDILSEKILSIALFICGFDVHCVGKTLNTLPSQPPFFLALSATASPPPRRSLLVRGSWVGESEKFHSGKPSEQPPT